MTGALNEKQLAWLDGALGMKVAARPPARDKSADEAEPSASSPGEGPAAAAPSGPAVAAGGHAFDIGLPGITLKKFPLFGGKISLQGQLNVKLKGRASLDAADATNINFTKIALVHGSKMAQLETEKIQNGSLFKNIHWEGLSIKTTTTTSLGTFDVELKLAGINKSVSHDGITVLPTFLQGTVSLTPAALRIPDNTEIVGLKLTDMYITAGGSVSIGPDVKEILKDWLIKQAEQRGLDVAKSGAEKVADAALAGISLDAVISLSLIGGGIASVMVIVRAFSLGGEYKSLGDDIGTAWHQIDAGWRAGACGRAAPGNSWGNAGHTAGKFAFDASFKKIKTEHPDAADEDITKLIADYVTKTFTIGIPSDQAAPLHYQVRVNAWNSFLANHTTVLTEKEARDAFQICFTDTPPPESKKEWQKYLEAHPYGKYL